ncbi:MAG: hypothetical protein C7B45_13705 [Sulfobacillus acidophilus]|uniref:ATPase n=1 Tax=Sulfobacillus acidophilus TaxID=53633 RepID=A0A2T2WEM2_9FIRM|nr:MAG: hypothetical protein C7B45_13705 [Sulfobacillus acidophilus]
MENETVVSEINYLLEHLEQLLAAARRLPWGHSVLIDAEQVRTIIDQVRHALPESMRQAEWVLRERDRILEEAGHNADQVMNDALERVHALALDSQVVKEAQIRAEAIIEEAEKRAQEIHRGAISYADEVLAGLDDQIAKLQMSVRQDRQSLRPRSSA